MKCRRTSTIWWYWSLGETGKQDWVSNENKTSSSLLWKAGKVDLFVCVCVDCFGMTWLYTREERVSCAIGIPQSTSEYMLERVLEGESKCKVGSEDIEIWRDFVCGLLRLSCLLCGVWLFQMNFVHNWASRKGLRCIWLKRWSFVCLYIKRNEDEYCIPPIKRFPLNLILCKGVRLMVSHLLSLHLVLLCWCWWAVKVAGKKEEKSSRLREKKF